MQTQTQTKNKQPLTAAQRLEGLEESVRLLDQALRNVTNNLATITQALKLLGNKTDAIVKANSRGIALNDEIISQIMVENNVEELEQKVKDLVSAGLLAQSESISDTSFIVGRELDAETKKVVNPRVQIAYSTLNADVKEKLLGKKAGDVVNFGGDTLEVEIEAVYDIVQPKAANTEDAQA